MSTAGCGPKYQKYFGNNIRIIGLLEDQEDKCYEEAIVKEIIKNNFPELRNLSTEIQEAQRNMEKINLTRKTPRHILLKLTKSKDKDR